MDLDTFHNRAETLASGFKALTEEDLDRIAANKKRANRSRWIAIAVIGVLVFLGCLAGTAYASQALSGSSTPVHHTAPRPAPTKTVTVSPPSSSQQPAGAPAALAPVNPPAADPYPYSVYGPYLTALADAGITAPAGWAIQTEQNLENAWAAGETEAQTDQQYLIPGGIYPWHLATFDSIVHQYFG